MKISQLKKETPAWLFSSLAVIALSAGQAHAAVLASEDFTSYQETSLGVGTWNAGTGFTGAWINTSTNPFLPSVDSAGILHTESPSTAERHKGMRRTLSTSYNTATSGTLWGGVTISVTNVGETTQYAWLSFLNGESTEVFRFGRHDNATLNANWQLQVSNNVANLRSSTEPVVLGEAAKLLYKIDYVDGNTIFSLWVNSTATAEGDLGAADATFTQSGSLTFDGIRLQSRASATFDDFILATSFADVVPEPSSAMLGVLGSSLLLLRKRRIG